MNAEPSPASEPSARVLQMVSEGFRLLAALHEEVTRASPEPADAQRHVTQATRELAAIQRMFERRGRGR